MLWQNSFTFVNYDHRNRYQIYAVFDQNIQMFSLAIFLNFSFFPIHSSSSFTFLWNPNNTFVMRYLVAACKTKVENNAVFLFRFNSVDDKMVLRCRRCRISDERFDKLLFRWRQFVGMQWMCFVLKRKNWFNTALFLVCPAVLVLTLPIMVKLVGNCNKIDIKTFSLTIFFLRLDLEFWNLVKLFENWIWCSTEHSFQSLSLFCYVVRS